MADFPFLSYTSTSEIPTLSYTWSLKKVPIPFYCCKCTVFQIWINHKNRKFVFSTFSQPWNVSVGPFGPFHCPKWQIFLPFHILQLVKSLPFHIPDSWKKDPFLTEPPVLTITESTPPLGPSHHANLIQCCFADKFFQLAWEDIHWDNAYTCKLFLFSEKSQVELEESEFKLWNITSLRKQLTFCDATTDLPAKRRLRNKRRNSILMTRHRSDLGGASDWLKQIFHAARPIRSSTQLWVVTRHQYGISALVSQTSFCW